MGLAFIAHRRVRREAFGQRFSRAGCFDPQVAFDGFGKRDRHGAASAAHPARIDCADTKMSLGLPNGKNARKSKVLTSR